jgi:hypothetical protein
LKLETAKGGINAQIHSSRKLDRPGHTQHQRNLTEVIDLDSAVVGATQTTTSSSWQLLEDDLEVLKAIRKQQPS